MHEIGHGLGFWSSANWDNASSSFLTPTSPFIYDRFIDDNQTGFDVSACSSMSPTLTSFLSAMTFSNPEFNGFCNGTGGYDASCSISCTPLSPPPPAFPCANIFFEYSGSTQLAQTNPPSGSSVSHLWQPDASNYDEMMQPNETTVTTLYPSLADVSILNAIGWNASMYTLVGSTATINDPSGTCTGTPNQVLNADGSTTYSYCSTMGGTFIPGCYWTLVLFATDGIQTIYTTSASWATWSFTLAASAMSGHTWKRDMDGRVEGMIALTQGAPLYSGGTMLASLAIGVNYAPQTVSFSARNSSTYWCQCDQEALYFYSPGATSYQVSKRAQFFNGWWSGWSTPVTVTSGTYTYSGLDQYDNYQFQVIASNANGSVTSTILTRPRCQNFMLPVANPSSIAASPIMSIYVNNYGSTSPTNPVDMMDQDCSSEGGSTDPTLSMDNSTATVAPAETDPCPNQPQPSFLTSSATLTNVTNPETVYTFSFDGSTSNVQINVQNVQPGIYVLTLTSTTGLTTSTQVEIDN